MLNCNLVGGIKTLFVAFSACCVSSCILCFPSKVSSSAFLKLLFSLFMMNLSRTSCCRVDSSHLQQKSTSRVRVDSFGAVDSSPASRVIFRIRLESSRRKLRLKSESMTRRIVTTLLFRSSLPLVL
jgi:hypothetical protein